VLACGWCCDCNPEAADQGGGQGNGQGANRRGAPAECAIVMRYKAMSANPEKRTDPMSSGYQQTRTGMV